MGLFSAQGVKPVHLDLKDGGIPFEEMGSMKVTIHYCSFSPENASFQMENNVEVCSFFSLALHGFRRVIGFHAFPRYVTQEESYREAVKNSENLFQLINNLSVLNPNLGTQLTNIFQPLNN